jgi:hypothetical protein
MLVKIALKVAEMTCVLLGETTELKSREPLGIGTDDAAVILKHCDTTPKNMEEISTQNRFVSNNYFMGK